MLTEHKDIMDKLLEAFKFHPEQLSSTPSLVTKEKGVYAFVDNFWPHFEIYIGSAIGKGGLYQRICKQHLNLNYLEARKEKQTKFDHYQLKVENRLIRNNKVCIEKSMFRKNLSRKHRLLVGEETLNFINENFLISFVPLPSIPKQKIREIEKEFIRDLKPKYNIIGKN